MMSWLAAWIPGGAEGVPIPYSPRMDDGITIVLLCCFFLSAYVLSRSRRFLLQLVKDFLLHRERTSIFATSTAGDMRYLLLLILQTCILSGVCIFNYCNDIQPELVHHVPPFALLGRLFYSFKDRYMFTGTFRRDGYSGFGSNNPWGNFGSVGLSWVFSEENFMSDAHDWMDMGKLRVSWNIFISSFV